MAFDYNELLSGVVSPEVISNYQELSEVLAELGPTPHEDELEYYASIEDNEDPSASGITVDIILRTAANKLLRNIYVEVSEDLPIAMLTTLLRGMQIEEGDLLLSLEDIVAEDRAPEETLLDILEAVTPYSAEDWLPHITLVDSKLIDAIKERIDRFSQVSNVVLDESDQIRYIHQNEQLMRINALHTLNPDALSLKALEEGMQVGTGMESLFGHYADHLTTVSMEKAVTDVVSLCVLAGTDKDAMLDEAMFFLEDLYPELSDTQKARQCLVKSLEQYNF